MSRLPLVLGLALLLVAVPAMPALAQSDDDDAASDRRRGEQGPADLGVFRLEEGARRATGEHVAFTYSEAGVQAFSKDGVALFDISVSAPADDDEDRRVGARAEGSQMRVRMPNYEFIAHDNPGGVSRMKADGAITVTFVEGTLLARDGEGHLTFQSEGIVGTMRGESLSANGRVVNAEDDVLIYLAAPRGDFDRHRADIGEAIARRHVGAEGTFNLGERDVEKDVVSYGNVTMTTVKAEKGNLTVMVEGHGFDGRVLVLNVDGRVLGAARADELAITLDNLTIPRADDLADILDPDNDGYTPEYYVVHDAIAAPEAFQLIVTVPHYSVHTLSVTTAFVLPPPSVMIGIVAGLALLVPAGLVLFRRK